MSERPGKIKEIIPVELGYPRDRSDDEFLTLRKKVLLNFIEKQDKNIEYYI